MPSGTNPLPEPMLTKVCVAIWRHLATMNFNNDNSMIYIYVLTRYIGSTRWSELELELKNLELECEWVISFRANFCNQLTCIPFAVTNKVLPVKGLAEDPINKLIFLQFNSWLLTWKMAWIREEVVNESKQKWKLKTHQVSRNFTIYTSCLPDFHGRYTQV